MRKFLFILIFLLAPVFIAYAAEDFYTFKTPTDQARFETLTTELRCLVCQNQNLAESNAALANDLRGQIFQQIQKGQTNKEIIEYLVARYGDFILYSPPMNRLTLGLWFGPFVILIASLSFLVYYLKKNKRE